MPIDVELFSFELKIQAAEKRKLIGPRISEMLMSSIIKEREQ